MGWLITYLAPDAKISTVLALVKNEITERNTTAENTLATRRPPKLEMLGTTSVGARMTRLDAMIARARLS
jgi:hypothetical protein